MSKLLIKMLQLIKLKKDSVIHLQQYEVKIDNSRNILKNQMYTPCIIQYLITVDLRGNFLVEGLAEEPINEKVVQLMHSLLLGQKPNNDVFQYDSSDDDIDDTIDDLNMQRDDSDDSTDESTNE